MDWFKNMTVGVRLISGFIFVAAISVAVGTLGIVNMSKMNDMADQMYTKELLGLSYVQEANINLIYIGRARGNFLLATTEVERTRHKAAIAKYISTMHDYLAKARPIFVTEKAAKIFSDVDADMKNYLAQMDEVLLMAAAEKFQERNAQLLKRMSDVRATGDKIDDLMTDLTDMTEARAKQASQDTAVLYKSSRTIMIMLILGALVLGIAIGMVITRGLVRQLGAEPADAVALAGQIAHGDLSGEISLRKDDTSSLLFAMREMRNSLVRIVSEVRAGTDTIATASGQIAAGNQDLSSRTEQQASSLEETASSMEELTSTVKQNADNSRQANQLALSAAEVAVKGGEVVSQVVLTMQEINATSQRVADIVSVIDGIAFQTNILALNAAVEAARAGEQGRGFAVVASEVRNLAQRSAAAAKEIKVLIDASVASVGQGASLASQAGTTMTDVVASIHRVTDIMSEITAASQEQTAGIEQINVAIIQMDNVTQQNAALVEEAAAAADAMQDQACNLAKVVSVFKIAGERMAVFTSNHVVPRSHTPSLVADGRSSRIPQLAPLRPRA